MDTSCSACHTEPGTHRVQIEADDALRQPVPERRCYRTVVLCDDCCDLYYQGMIKWGAGDGWIRGDEE